MGGPLTAPAGRPLWWDTCPDDPTPRPPLAGDAEADVVVVGAGYTGLWTAHYLLDADPGLRVLVLEAETAGFGASGRNGGWCSALFPASSAALAALPGSGRAAARDQHAAMRDAVDEVGRVADRLGIDAGYAKGGTVVPARSPAQLARARAEVAEAREWGRGPDDLRLLDRAAAAGRIRARGALAATYTPDCAALHPGRLVRGLARAVERQGGALHEGTRVTRIEPRLVVTPYGRVRARHVVRATEGYTASLSGHRRRLAPVHSLVIATEPLPPEVWAEIGLASRETFSDHRHLVVYGQRTDDDRMLLGGRGAPYRMGSRTGGRVELVPSVFAHLRRIMVDLFPVLSAARVSHAWGGSLGIPRDWCASVGLDRATGLAWAGGYVGDGVATSNLAGRTLRDLLLDRDSGLVRLPWVGHRSPAWEPEPLRWVGVNAGLRAMAVADFEERITGRPSRVATLTSRLLGVKD